MFAYLNNPVYETWLTLLLAVWALLLFGGFVLGSKRDGRRMPAWTRLISSLVLVVAGFSWAFISRDFDTLSYALLLAIGMAFGFLGDLFLAHLFASGKIANMGASSPSPWGMFSISRQSGGWATSWGQPHLPRASLP